MNEYRTFVPGNAKGNDFHYVEVDIAATNACVSSADFNRGGDVLPFFLMKRAQAPTIPTRTFFAKTIDRYRQVNEFTNSF